MRNATKHAFVVLALLLAARARAMTPGSMASVCFADGKCTSIDGGTIDAIATQLRASGQLDNVRDLNLRAFSGPIALSEVLRAFTKVSKLELEARGNEALDLAPLVGYAPLRELTVAKAPAATAGTLAKLTQLEALDLSRSAITQLGAIGALPNLKRLVLNDSPVTSLVGLEKSKLEALELARTKITDLTPLRAVTSLRKLRFNETRVHDLGPLAALTSLVEIDAMESKVVDLAPLAKLTKLRDLNLGGTRVKSLKPLHALSSLAFVSVDKGAIAAVELAAFAKALPDCKVSD